MAMIQIPGTAVAAFYMDGGGEVTAAEVMMGVVGRMVNGKRWKTKPPVNSPPIDIIATQPTVTVPNSAVFAIYIDGDSHVVATEHGNALKGRVVKNLGDPIEGPPVCPTRCQVQGPNGTYCIPGCH